MDLHTARCTTPPNDVTDFEIWLGDRDDTAFTDGAWVYGEAGADRLVGQSGMISGGPGPDVLIAGREGVLFADDDGREPARDHYIGSSAPDGISYGRPGGVRVDLSRSRAGTEEDILSRVDDALGGVGDDVLIGTPASNTLTGGPGADRLVGGAGNDTIYTGISSGLALPDRGGPDVVEAGSGRDTVRITSLHRRGDRIRCGDGSDEVQATGFDDLVRGCELVVPGDTLQHVRLRERLSPIGATFLIAHACMCSGGGYVGRVGRAVVAEARGRPGSVRVRLNALGRRLLAARGRLEISVTYRGESGPAGFRTVLEG